MKSSDPLIYLGLIQEVELALAKEGNSDCVTIDVSLRKEVDKGLVVVIGIIIGNTRWDHIRVVSFTTKVRTGVEEVVEKGKIVIDNFLRSKGHQIGPDLKGSLFCDDGIHFSGEYWRFWRECRGSIQRRNNNEHKVRKTLKKVEILAIPIDAKEVMEVISSNNPGVSHHSLHVGIKTFN